MKSRPLLSGARKSSQSFPVMAACLVAVLSTAPAASLYWDATPGAPDGASNGGPGSWDTATANWDDGDSYELWNNGGNDTAVFAGTAGTVTIDTLDDLGVTVGGLSIGNGYTIAGEALTFGAAGDIHVSSGTGKISAEVAGSVGITKTGGGILQLLATNSFTGNTTISGGTLRVGDNNTAATLGPASYAGDILNNGILFFTNNQSQTLTGIISGSGVLNKGGSNTLTLTGANTYTGKTIIEGSGAGGPSLSVSSFNSVDIDDLDPNLPLPSSSLGAPTTVANGTIQLGKGGNIRNCSLIYTGPGETTDRVMNVRFDTTAKHTISNTGGGLLKFTSNFTTSQGNGNAGGGLILRGSGNGEVAQIGTMWGILEKADAGTWTIGGTNSANSVKVSGGALIVNGSLATAPTGATPAGSVSIASAATLTVNGSISAPATTISNASAVLDGTGSLIFHIDDTTSDLVTMTNGTLMATGLTVAVNETGAGLTQAEYVLVNVTGGTLDGTFAGVTGASGYELNYDTPGQVKLVQTGGSAYGTWSGGSLPGDDDNNDGVQNGAAWALGAADPDANAIGLLPDLDNTSDPTYLIFSFNRADDANDDPNTTISVEYGSDLVGWTPAVDDGDDVIITETPGSPNDAVEVKLKRSSIGASGTVFVRLEVIVTP